MDRAFIFGTVNLSYFDPSYDTRRSFILKRNGKRWVKRGRDGTETVIPVSKIPYYPNGILDIKRGIAPMKFTGSSITSKRSIPTVAKKEILPRRKQQTTSTIKTKSSIKKKPVTKKKTLTKRKSHTKKKSPAKKKTLAKRKSTASKRR